MGKDFYTQPDAADPVLEPDSVLAIVRRHAPGVQAVTAVDESGGEARTYASVPRVIGGGAEPRIEYNLMTRMPGVPIQAAGLDGKLRRSRAG